MKFSPRQFPTQPKARLFPAPQRAPRKTARHRLIVVTFIIGLLFIFHLSSMSGFLHVKQIAVSGIAHYSKNDVIVASGLSLGQSNVHTVSASDIEKRLKRKLSYIKQANISKSFMKRTLTIQVTEREPVALLKYPEKGRQRFVLVDLEGYVLEYVNSAQATNAITTIIGDGQQIPGIGDQVPHDKVQLALRVLHSALSLTPEIIPTLRTIDADQPDRIILQFSNLPVAWLSADLLETGIHHISLFFNNRETLFQKGQEISDTLEGYLDARFEGAVYWGGK